MNLAVPEMNTAVAYMEAHLHHILTRDEDDMIDRPINPDIMSRSELAGLEGDASANEAVRDYAGMKLEAKICLARGQHHRVRHINALLNGKLFLAIPDKLRWK